MSFCWFPKTANYFYPHPPRGGRHKTTVPCLGRVIFLSTPSARRATDRQKHSSRTFTISIHALREEGDGMCWGFPRRRPKFLSTPSARRATISGAEHRAHGTDFYPRPPRGGRPASVLPWVHASRFLSTPSARRATRAVIETAQALKNFYPRPPRGGRRRPSVSSLQTCDFYPRPPRGGRRTVPGITGDVDLFLSTPSARRATSNGLLNVGGQAISIHALREEGDTPRLPRKRVQQEFLSTPSARRATRFRRKTAAPIPFLSTPSARRATTHPAASRYR